MVLLKSINFGYKGENIFREFSFDAKDDEVTCILGSSGCGKTTILRLIAGLEAPNKGNVEVLGQIVSSSGKIIVPPYKRGVGYIFQDLALWQHFTVFENIAFGLKENKIKDYRQRVEQMIEKLQIRECAEKYPSELSGGQRQLVAIARALVLQPKILLMDEPLNNLDVNLKRNILDIIRRLRDELKLTIIYVTHDYREAFAIADTIIVMSRGKIEASGSVDEIKRSQNNYVQLFFEY